MNLLIGILIGLLFGVGLTLFILKLKAQSLMLHENVSLYPFEETEKRLTAASSETGWKVPKVHDLQETMANNGFTVKAVKVLEICKPIFANQILERGNERIASSLIPCRIAIYEKPDGKVYVSRLNALLLGKFMKGVIPQMMTKAAAETEIIINSVI